MLSHVERYPTTTVAGLEMNTVADGFFLLGTWVIVVAASLVTLVSWRRGRLAPSWSFQIGLVLAGWGTFNVFEGVVDHHLLGVHHVRDDLGGPLSWDIAFLTFGVLLIVGGWLLQQRGLRALEPRAA
jgi:uncharacterized membrane protein